MDTVSILVVIGALLALAWAIRDGSRRRRAARQELATRTARSAAAELQQSMRPVDMRTLWLDTDRRERIARNVMEQVGKHHNHTEYKH
jgi:hypothetical protein